MRCRKAVRCGTDPASIHCDQVCGKLLDCKEHTCQKVEELDNSKNLYRAYGA